MYLFALALKNETNPDTSTKKLDAIFPNINIRTSFFVDGSYHGDVDYFVEAVSLAYDDDEPLNPYYTSGVSLFLLPINMGDIEYSDHLKKLFEKNNDRLWAQMAPIDKKGPYELYSGSDPSSPNIRLLTGTLTYQVRIPHIFHGIAISYLRDWLVASYIDAVIVEESGKTHKVPSHFWRSDKGGQLIKRDALTFLQIDDNIVIGNVFIDYSKLHHAWEIPFEDQSSKPSPKSLRSEPSPYIEFMLKCSEKFRLQNGRSKDGKYIKKEEIEEWLNNNWIDALGKPSPAIISYMATLIRHPDATKGGNRTLTARPPTLIQGERSDPENQSES